MYLEYHHDGHFEAATGTLQVDDTEGLLEYHSCMWIGDTKDGGASEWLDSISGRTLKKWAQEAGDGEERPSNHGDSAPNRSTPATKPIYAHCHCKGVEFWVEPPNATSETARSAFPDLMVPFHLGSNASANHSNTTWWLRDDNTRFLAGTCACHSCRRASGFFITFWAFVPTANIYLDSGLTGTFPQNVIEHEHGYWGSIKAYHSSDGVTRSFCGRCGATVLWDGGIEKGRDGLVDVAVGLLDAESGARAEELLSWWTERVSFEEFAVNKSLVKALQEGLGSWGRRRENMVFKTLRILK